MLGLAFDATFSAASFSAAGADGEGSFPRSSAPGLPSDVARPTPRACGSGVEAIDRELETRGGLSSEGRGGGLVFAAYSSVGGGAAWGSTAMRSARAAATFGTLAVGAEIPRIIGPTLKPSAARAPMLGASQRAGRRRVRPSEMVTPDGAALGGEDPLVSVADCVVEAGKA